MNKARLISAVAIFVVTALSLGGCAPASITSQESTIDAAAQAKVATLRALPFGGSNVAVITQKLRDAGVEIASTWKDSSTAVVRATAWQVQNMAAEAANGGGVSGAALEALHPTPKGAPPVDYLISAWAISYDSDAARFAHALLGSRDFHHPQVILFPSVVTTLFFADATKGDKSKPVAFGVGPQVQTASARGISVGAVCDAVGKFTDYAIAAVVNALHVDVSKSSGFWSFLGTIWNLAVNLAARALKGLIDTITRPVTQVIVTIFGAVETLRQLSSYLYVWRTKLVNEPDSNKFGVDGKKEYGRVTLSIQDNRLPIPEEIVKCAAAFDVDVRNAGSANGSLVSWDPQNTARPDLSSTYTSEDKIDENQIARYQYTTGQESAKLAAGGSETVRAGFLRLAVSIQRNDIEKVRALFVHVLSGEVPASIRQTVEYVAKPVVDSTTTLLTSLTDVKADTVVLISYHGEKGKKAPKPKRSGNAATGCGPTRAAKGHYVGTGTATVTLRTNTEHFTWDLDVTSPGDNTYSGTLKHVTVTVSSLSGLTTTLHYSEPVSGVVNATSTAQALTGHRPATGGPALGDCSHLHLVWVVAALGSTGDNDLTIDAKLVP